MTKPKSDLNRELEKIKDDIRTMDTIMSNCYDDEAYRHYSRTRDGFVAQRIRLEKELEEPE